MCGVIVKSKMKEKIMTTWSRHERIGSKKGKPKQPKPEFHTSATLKRPIDP